MDGERACGASDQIAENGMIQDEEKAAILEALDEYKRVKGYGNSREILPT